MWMKAWALRVSGLRPPAATAGLAVKPILDSKEELVSGVGRLIHVDTGFGLDRLLGSDWQQACRWVVSKTDSCALRSSCFSGLSHSRFCQS